MSSKFKILSSQRYLDRDIVDKKKEYLEKKSPKCVEIPCSDVGEIDGVNYAIVVDKHHLMEAAKELDLTIRFVIDKDPEGLTGDKLLEARYIDSSYYDVETGIDEW